MEWARGRAGACCRNSCLSGGVGFVAQHKLGACGWGCPLCVIDECAPAAARRHARWSTRPPSTSTQKLVALYLPATSYNHQHPPPNMIAV